MSLRGNVQTRLGKLDAGEFDAIILATSGLQRLELEARITAEMDAETCLPACGQGALGISATCRTRRFLRCSSRWPMKAPAVACWPSAP